jgi:DNA-binding transcriptional ArsR family regulator
MSKPMTSLALSSDELSLMYAMQLLGDKTRFKIFKLLLDQHEYCVSEIGISMSAVSQHFKQFEILGLVDKQRFGQKICYQLKADHALITVLAPLTNKGDES